MRKFIISSLMLCSIMFFVAGSAFAKPGADAPEGTKYVGNDMPSGPHANLNMHGKDPANFACPQKTNIGGSWGYWKEIVDGFGNVTGYELDTSIFIPEYTSDPICNDIPQTIVTQSGKKGGKPRKGTLTLPNDKIVVTDACTECIDGNSAAFQLPPCDAGYKVYGRALGKPSEDADHIRKIIVSAGDLLTAEDESGNNLLELGEIIGTKITKSTYSEEATMEKGKPVTLAFSDLFKFTGSICYLEKPEGWDFDPCNEDPFTKECRNSEVALCCTDLDADGVYDVCVLKKDTNVDGFIDGADSCPEWKKFFNGVDWICYLDENFNDWFDVGDEASVPNGEFDACPSVEPLTAYCQYYENVWIFSIADLVEYYFGVVNDGVKLLQLRFYPIDPECFASN